MIDGRYRADGVQAEFEPGSRGRVLRNRLGIARVHDMHRAESEALLAVQEWAVGHFGASHRFTTTDIVLLHRRWLGQIYAWAGEYRQVNVSKGGFMFAAAAQVPRLLAWLMALQAGWPPLDFSPLAGRGKAVYFAPIQAALARDFAPLESCFSRVLARTSRVCARRV